MKSPVLIGVSACLLGEQARYDGGHKHDRNITDTLGEYFSFVPICPEVGCGLAVPRETMRLEGNPQAPRLMTCRTRIDMTGQMLEYCATKLAELEYMDLGGFIFKERSPSCGLTPIPLDSGIIEMSAGLFAHELARHFPLMPLAEAEPLNDPRIRNNFIESVFLYRRKFDDQKNDTASLIGY